MLWERFVPSIFLWSNTLIADCDSCHTCISKCYIRIFDCFLFRSLPYSHLRLDSNVVYTLFMRCGILAVICSCALTQLQNHVHVIFFPAYTLVLLEDKAIYLLELFYFSLFFIGLQELTALINLLFNSSVSRFCSTFVGL